LALEKDRWKKIVEEAKAYLRGCGAKGRGGGRRKLFFL
jgi:hypothetical protein